MRWFLNLRISTKLVSSFVLIALIVGVVGYFGIVNLGKMSDEMDKLYDDNVNSITQISRMMNRASNVRAMLQEMALEDDRTENASRLSEIESNNQVFNDAVSLFKEIEATDEELVLISQLDQMIASYHIELEKLIEYFNRIEKDKFTVSILAGGDFNTIDRLMKDKMDEIILLNVDYAADRIEAGQSTYNYSVTITWTVIVIAVIISLVLGIFISITISRPVNRIVQLVSEVADGDLRNTVDVNTKDEIGELAASVNQMVGNLRALITTAMGSAQSVSAASEQISASTEEIASGSNSQAQAAQNISELFKELSYAINSVAASAEEAAQLSGDTARLAKEGELVVEQSLDGMNRVNKQVANLENDSNKIGEIIEVIDDIADQTNLLALNAAIEAARAGEQGRGFAVVADEVRKLAERSSEATKQITAIIKGMQTNTMESVKAVAIAVEKSELTGQAFTKILGMVNASSQKVSEIAAASEEQAVQTDEVVLSVQAISASSEEASAASEETASSSQALANLAEELNDAVSVFKI